MARTVTGSPWTSEDRALMLAYRVYKATLCPGCGHPKETAWHFDNEGEFEVKARYTCHPCTVKNTPGDGRSVDPVDYVVVLDARDYAESPLTGHYTEFGSDDFSHPPGAHVARPQTPREEETL